MRKTAGVHHDHAGIGDGEMTKTDARRQEILCPGAKADGYHPVDRNRALGSGL
jgi:hypothetical protein